MNEWVNLISSVGFPIVCCIMMWQTQRTTMKELSNKLSENTTVMTRMCEKLDTIIGGQNDKTNVSNSK